MSNTERLEPPEDMANAEYRQVPGLGQPHHHHGSESSVTSLVDGLGGEGAHLLDCERLRHFAVGQVIRRLGRLSNSTVSWSSRHCGGSQDAKRVPDLQLRYTASSMLPPQSHEMALTEDGFWRWVMRP